MADMATPTVRAEVQTPGAGSDASATIPAWAEQAYLAAKALQAAARAHRIDMNDAVRNTRVALDAAIVDEAKAVAQVLAADLAVEATAVATNPPNVNKVLHWALIGGAVLATVAAVGAVVHFVW